MQAENIDPVPELELSAAAHTLISDEHAVLAVIDNGPSVPAVPQVCVHAADQSHKRVADRVFLPDADTDIPDSGDVIFLHHMKGDGHIRSHDDQVFLEAGADLQDLLLLKKQLLDRSPV